MKGLFSKNLFCEGMKQLRVIGIISLIVATLMSFFIVFGMNLEAKEIDRDTKLHYMDMGIEGEMETETYTLSVDIESCIPVGIVAWLVVPMSMLMLFGFLNKRNSSDFYHGIVQKRSALGISFSAAVFVWALIIMADSILVSAVTTGVLKYVVLADAFWWNVALFLAESIAVSIYWIGVLLLSMSLSGTMLTNLAVAMIIMLFPKVLSIAVNAIVVEFINIYPFVYEDSYLSGKYNLVTGVVNKMLWGGDYGGWQSVAYTAILGIILFAFGCVAFCMRKSEAATQAAPTRKLQAVFRIVPAFVVTIIPVAIIYEAMIEKSDLMEEQVFAIVICYVIAILVYFLYEIITTRKWRNIGKIAPGLIVLAVLDVLLLGTLFARREMILSVQPHNSDYISIIGTRASDWDNEDYFMNRSGEMEITDPKLIALFEESLANNIQEIRDGESYLGRNKDRYLVKFNQGGKNIYRLVFVESSNANYITNTLSNQANVNALLDIPSLKKRNVRFGNLFETDLPVGMVDQLLEQYIDELIRSDKGYVEDVLFSYYFGINHDNIDSIEMSVNYKGKWYWVSLPLFTSMDFTEEYLHLSNKILSGNMNLIEEYIKAEKGLSEETDLRLSIRRYDSNFTSWGDYEEYNYDQGGYINLYSGEYQEMSEEQKQILEKAASLFKNSGEQKILSENGYVQITLYNYSKNYHSSNIFAYYPITKDNIEVLKVLTESFK